MRRKIPILILALLLAVFSTLLSACRPGHWAPLRAAQDLAAQLVPEEAPDRIPEATLAPTRAPMSSASAGALAALEGTLQGIYEQVSPSVVSIQVSQKQTVTGEWPFGEWSFPGFGQQGEPREQYRQSSGSGFVWDEQGHIVTNNHVVEGADTIRVTFADGTMAKGQVIGRDPDSDLAVVKVDLPAGRLQPVELADSTQLKVGSLAVAIGQPFGLENTMTVGFVSAVGRSLPVESAGSRSADTPTYTIPDVIQTDAPINPGNSGGVLLNSDGQVIGVTTAIVSPAQASAGVGFAVPSAIVRQVVPVLIEKGRYAYPWLGISGITLYPDLATAMQLDAGQRGALVVDVTPGAAGDKAGLRGCDRRITLEGQDVRVGGDVIVAVDGQTVKTFDDLVSYLVRSTRPGQKITLTVLRAGREQEVEATLGERSDRTRAPSQEAQQMAAEGAWLGIGSVTLSAELAEATGLPEGQQGALLQEVVVGSPADKAGLRGSYKPVTASGQRLLVGGDVIVAWDGQAVTTAQELGALVGRARAGQEVTLTVLRDGEELEVKVTLEAQPGS